MGTFRDLTVYKKAFELSMAIFRESKKIPDEEKFGLVSQIRRSSRSVCANIGEAYRKRQYEAHFVIRMLCPFAKLIKVGSRQLTVGTLLLACLLQTAYCQLDKNCKLMFVEYGKATDADMENAETQVWLDFALACEYISKESIIN